MYDAVSCATPNYQNRMQTFHYGFQMGILGVTKKLLQCHSGKAKQHAQISHKKNAPAEQK